MKNAVILSTALIVASTSPAQADMASEAQQAGVFTTGAVVGTVLGGPIGMLAGAAGGYWMAEKIKTADTLDEQVSQSRRALKSAKQSVDQLETLLDKARSESEQYAQMVLEQLQLELLFKTDQRRLSATGKARLATVAEFLNRNPAINIRLDGYADPRGDARYNQALSQERAQAVADMLIALNIDPARISTHSHGASASTAQPGDYDAYALERLVRITLTRDDDHALARVDIKQ